tara:strand:+ start:820 stop:1293 length:474 start_codon:yes stop_codon:yes gene_type:complete
LILSLDNSGWSVVSLESKFKFFRRINDIEGKKIIEIIEIIIQIFLQSKKDNKKIINTGKINSAEDKPNHIVLSALPLDFVKYLEIVVEAVCDIKPCPENLIKKTAANKKLIDCIFEKKKQEIDNNIVTREAKVKIFTSSIFFPIQIITKLLNKVADA